MRLFTDKAPQHSLCTSDIIIVMIPCSIIVALEHFRQLQSFTEQLRFNFHRKDQVHVRDYPKQVSQRTILYQRWQLQSVLLRPQTTAVVL